MPPQSEPTAFDVQLLHGWHTLSLATPTTLLLVSTLTPHLSQSKDGWAFFTSHSRVPGARSSDRGSCYIRQRSCVRSAEPRERKERTDSRSLSSVGCGLQRHLLTHNKQMKVPEQEEEGDKSRAQRRPLAAFVSTEDRSAGSRWHFSQKQTILWEFEFVI